MDRIEHIILRNLVYNEEYSRKVLPYIKNEYFSEQPDKLLFLEVEKFITKYNNLPNSEILKIEVDKLKKEQGLKDEISSLVDMLEKEKDTNQEAQWLLDESEKWCKEKAVYNAVLESIQILDDKKGTRDRGAIPQMLADALGVSFDSHIGHDYFEDAEERYEFYHKIENKIPFDLDMFNKVTNGGVTRKTLNCFMAGTNVGKSLIMCHMAAAYLNQGLNVLYITLEMAEEVISQRIDANQFNIEMNDIVELPHDAYTKKITKLRANTTGKLIVKEYPTAGASAIHFRSLINELLLKKNFKPDVIFVDYVNICCSARIKPGGQSNMYLYVKSIVEELRGLMVETNCIGWTATQLNRNGFDSSDPGMSDVAESWGLPQTVDFLMILVSNEELEELNQWMCIQVKNRYNHKKSWKRFVLGVDVPKMKVYNLEESAQTLTDDEPQVKESKNDKKSKFGSIKV